MRKEGEKKGGEGRRKRSKTEIKKNAKVREEERKGERGGKKYREEEKI